MAEINYIRMLREKEGKSFRAISKMTGISINTIRKYVDKEQWDDEKMPQTKQAQYHVLGEYLTVIDSWLEQDQKEPRKQQHTMTRIHKRLQEEYGYEGSYSSVKKYVRKKKEQMRLSKQEYTTKSGYLPLKHPKGHAQIDFGEFKYYDGLGHAQKGHALTITFPHSNAGFSQVFPSENSECLQEGMKRIFYHIGGVPIRITADNMSTAVTKINADGTRDLTESFTRFMMHHRFEVHFCNPNSGNEKGSVENKVGYSRRNFMVPVPTIEDFTDYNAQLLHRCEQDMERIHYKDSEKTLCGLFQEDVAALLSLPTYEYSVYRYDVLKSDKYGFITVNTVKYGLPPEYYGKLITAKIFYERIEFYYDHTLLTTYPRSYKHRDEVMDASQYLTAIQRKPGALEHTRFYDQIPKLWQDYLRQAERKERKNALKLLSEIHQEGNIAMSDDVFEMAHNNGRMDADSLRQCYLLMSKAEHHPKPLLLDEPKLGYHPDLGAYDVLTSNLSVEEVSIEENHTTIEENNTTIEENIMQNVEASEKSAEFTVGEERKYVPCEK